MSLLARLCCLLSLSVLAACATQPPPDLAVLTSETPEQMVVAIRAAAGDGSDELAVQPLRDAQVEDLRQDAQRLEGGKQYADAAKALDQALAIVADDPALLQERAEVAVLQRDFPGAGKLAERAYGLGSKVGPLCRRHWATIERVRLVHGDAVGAAKAKEQSVACKVAAPNRF